MKKQPTFHMKTFPVVQVACQLELLVKVCSCLSGGIDSPVAGYLALKRGVDIEAVHFASLHTQVQVPLKKAQDLTRKLTKFGGNIQFIEVPFTEIQEEIKG